MAEPRKALNLKRWIDDHRHLLKPAGRGGGDLEGLPVHGYAHRGPERPPRLPH